MLQPHGIPVTQAHVPQLPSRREEAPRRLPEDLGEDTLSALESASRFFGIQAVDLVTTLDEPRGRSPTAPPSMEVAVQEQFLGALLDQLAVVGMGRQWSRAVPVGNHPEGETTPEQGYEVVDHHPSLTHVGRSGVVDADQEALHG